MPGAGIPEGPPLMFGEVTFMWTVIALGMLAVLVGVLWLRRVRNNSAHGKDPGKAPRRGRPRLAT